MEDFKNYLSLAYNSLPEWSETLIISTRIDQIIGFSILNFLVRKINEKEIKRDTKIELINIKGYDELVNIPDLYFEYQEGSNLLNSYYISLVDGKNIYDYVYRIYRPYYSLRPYIHAIRDEIVYNYVKLFYNNDNENYTLVPEYRYDEFWKLRPALRKISIFNEHTKEREDNDKIINEIKTKIISEITNKVRINTQIKCLYLYGYFLTDKILIPNIISKHFRRRIYLISLNTTKNIFYKSLEEVVPSSIIIIKDIDKIFENNDEIKEFELQDIYNIFDILRHDILLIIISDSNSKIDELKNFTKISKKKIKFFKLSDDKISDETE